MPVARHPHARSRTIRLASCALSAALTACALALPGCTPGASLMMPAPLDAPGFSAQSSNSLPTPPSPDFSIFYATNRVPESPTRVGATYSATIAPTIRLGVAAVRLGPPGWDADRLAQELRAGVRPPITVTRMSEFGPLATPPGPSTHPIPDAAAPFLAALNHALTQSSRRDLYIYIPGINATFEEAMLRSAEFSYYLDRAGVFIAYGWPAHAHPFSYDADRRNALDSVDGFCTFVRFLQDRADAERIHIITSSAGAPLVSGLLASLPPVADPPPPPSPQHARIGQVIYAASDQNIDDFQAMLAAGADLAPEHITIYASSTDLGLVLTRHFGSGDRTIGRLPANLSETTIDLLKRHADHVTVVDATAAVEHAGRGDMWAHSYWYLNPWVSRDLFLVLRTGLPPVSRGLASAHDGALWIFPPNYPARVRAALSQRSINEASTVPPHPGP